MFVFNKTGEWLAAKDDKERSAIIAQSRKDAGSIKAIYKVSYSGVSIFKTLIPESITLGHHGVSHSISFTVFLFSNFSHLPFLPKPGFAPNLHIVVIMLSTFHPSPCYSGRYF